MARIERTCRQVCFRSLSHCSSALSYAHRGGLLGQPNQADAFISQMAPPYIVCYRNTLMQN